MRISFSSESTDFSKGTKFRRIEGEEFTFLYQRLFLSNNPSEYKIHAKSLRDHVRKDAELDFHCLHPNWFSEPVDVEDDNKIDLTVCNFCGYFEQCEKSSTEFFADIVTIYGSSLSRSFISETDLRRAFEFREPNSDRNYSDPFTGFSRRAGESRTLHLIDYKDMTDTLTNQYNVNYLSPCLGYDLMTRQPLWSLDFLLLGILENEPMFESIKSDINATFKLTHKDASVSDDLFIEHLLNSRKQEFSANDKKQLISELNSLAKIFFQHESLASIKNTPLAPEVDFPFQRGSTQGFHILVRLFELQPILIDSNDFRKKFPQTSQIPIHAEIGNPHRSDNQQVALKRLLPRFPAILFLPRNGASVRLDLPGCKIIDVIEAEVERPILLFDSLDFDLRMVEGWNLA